MRERRKKVRDTVHFMKLSYVKELDRLKAHLKYVGRKSACVFVNKKPEGIADFYRFAVERKGKIKNARVAYKFYLALPEDWYWLGKILPNFWKDRAEDLCQILSEVFGIRKEDAIVFFHKPTGEKGKNFHAHVVMKTVKADGKCLDVKRQHLKAFHEAWRNYLANAGYQIFRVRDHIPEITPEISRAFDLPVYLYKREDFMPEAKELYKKIRTEARRLMEMKMRSPTTTAEREEREKKEAQLQSQQKPELQHQQEPKPHQQQRSEPRPKLPPQPHSQSKPEPQQQQRQQQQPQPKPEPRPEPKPEAKPQPEQDQWKKLLTYRLILMREVSELVGQSVHISYPSKLNDVATNLRDLELSAARELLNHMSVHEAEEKMRQILAKYRPKLSESYLKELMLEAYQIVLEKVAERNGMLIDLSAGKSYSELELAFAKELAREALERFRTPEEAFERAVRAFEKVVRKFRPEKLSKSPEYAELVMEKAFEEVLKEEEEREQEEEHRRGPPRLGL